MLYIKCFLALVAVSFASLSWSNDDINIKEPPAWVIPQQLPKLDDIPTDQVQDGIYFLLIDKQIKAAEDSEAWFYSHQADYVINQAGVEG